VFLVTDWFFIQDTSLPGLGKLNIRIGDFFFLYFFLLYFLFLFKGNIKKERIHYFYIFLLMANIIAIFEGIQNTQLTFALRYFQVISLSISFFIGLFLINDIHDIRKLIKLLIIAFFLRELFLLIVLGAKIGYIKRFLTLTDPSSTSYIQNLAIYFFLYKFLTSNKKIVKTLSIILVVYLSFTILALGKMGGILTLVLGFLVMFKYALTKKGFLNIVVIGMIFLMTFLFVRNNEFVQNSINRISVISNNLNADPDTQWRLLAWAQGLDVFNKHLIFGGGYSWPDGWLLIEGEKGLMWGWGIMLHNEFLHILSSGGIVGFTVFMVFLINIINNFIRKIRKLKLKEDRMFAAIFFAAFITFIATGITNPSWGLFVSMVGWSFAAFGLRFIELKEGTSI